MKILKRTNDKRAKRITRHIRVRKKVIGTKERPRLNIFKGSRGLFAQVVDDLEQKTIIGVATYSKELKNIITGSKNNKNAAEKLGEIIANKCKEKGIEKVVFDRGGFKYHGVIKSFADSARKYGLKF